MTVARVDVQFIDPVAKAFADVIESMGQIKLKRGKRAFVRPEIEFMAADISGVIAMNSEQFLGSMAIGFEESVILKIFSQMLGTETERIDDDVKDAVAELTNIVFGNAKRDLNAAGHSIGMALPSVISGKGHSIQHNVEGICLLIPFESEDGNLFVECSLRAKG